MSIGKSLMVGALLVPVWAWAATKEIIKGLQGIYVRSYTFDQDRRRRKSY